ncbi:hypothetical protein D0T49_10625 [Paludibacter sp. 221]|uniref:hypothetical protein n=1 Tax=Paludibacter sp. 221 TaxID=2302939 RepID=UPI0013D1E355|nr:hypothetical protein [Paludibacter sp. 221]NDV47500.1 hypothetical protein [Paludibacter sp. 221]
MEETNFYNPPPSKDGYITFEERANEMEISRETLQTAKEQETQKLQSGKYRWVRSHKGFRLTTK